MSKILGQENPNVGVLWSQLKRRPANAQLWAELARCYASLELPWQAGYCARQATRIESQLSAKMAALLSSDVHSEGRSDAVLGRDVLASAASLAERFHQTVQDHPGDWLSWLYLTRLLDYGVSPPSLGAAAPALPSSSLTLQHAVDLEPIPGETLHRLGVWRLQAGDAHGAVTALSGLVDLRPLRFGSMMYLAEALLKIGNTKAAEVAFSRASLSPDPGFLVYLAQRTFALNYWEEAIAVLKKALTLSSDKTRPSSTSILWELAKIQAEVYLLSDSQQSLQQVLQQVPDHQEAKLLQAKVAGNTGDVKAYFDQLQQAYRESGDPLSRLISSVVMTSLYQDDLSAKEISDLHRVMCAPINSAFTQGRKFKPRGRAKRLKLGYVSGDLYRQHPVNIFMLPVLQHHDHQAFETFVYFTGHMFDEYTRQAKVAVDHWREASQLDDPALHRLIVDDQIDILIDLAGHTSSHRLGVFAMRAAPVQMTFLGYPSTTGLAQMDWIIGDETVTPFEHQNLYTEKIAQLPHSVFCWSPVDEYPLPSPRPDDAPIVFGSFNNAVKCSAKTLQLWADVLKAVPNAKLLLKAPSFRDQVARRVFTERLVALGIAEDRCEFRGPSGIFDMMQEYADVDIALDTVPYNGGTTTLQALWMGVPVVTLLGQNFVSRMGTSFLRTLGLKHLVATSDQEYVRIASQLAQDVVNLRSGRLALRERMQASKLCDIAQYTKDLESVYQSVWRRRDESKTRQREAMHGLD